MVVDMGLTKTCRFYKYGFEKRYCSYDPNFCPGISCIVYRDYVMSNFSMSERGHMFTMKDVCLSEGEKPVELWYRQMLILTSEALNRYGISLQPEFQFFFAQTGPGCFKKNVFGEIDGYFAVGRVEYTFLRSDFYGIPNREAWKRYEEVMRMIAEESERDRMILKLRAWLSDRSKS